MNVVIVSLLERDCQIEHGRRRLPQGKGRKTIVIQHKKSHKIAKSNGQVVMTECRNHLAASTGSQFSIYYWLFDLLILAHFLAKPSNWFSSYICDSSLAGRGKWVSQARLIFDLNILRSHPDILYPFYSNFKNKRFSFSISRFIWSKYPMSHQFSPNYPTSR